jgi:hypothetical protein
MPFLANSFTSMECLSNRFDMAKLIEATIIKGSIKLYPPVISAIRKMAVMEHEIIQKSQPYLP